MLLSLNLPPIVSTQGYETELVSMYRYLGIQKDDYLSFTPHTQEILKLLKIKLGFHLVSPLRQLVATSYVSAR